MKYEFTIFKSQFDNKTHKTMDFGSWDRFVDLLYKLSEKVKRVEIILVLLLLLLFFKPVARSNKSTLRWGGWCAVDVDDHVFLMMYYL